MNKGKRGTVCAARNCNNKTYNCNLSFFRFPKDTPRAYIWLSSCGREDLRDKLDKLHNYRLCAAHFKNNMYLNDLKTRLLPKAVPTIFECMEGGSSQASDNIVLRREIARQDAEEAQTPIIDSEHQIDGPTEPTLLEHILDEERELDMQSKTVNVDSIEPDSFQEELAEIETLHREIANLKRKIEEQEETIAKMKALERKIEEQEETIAKMKALETLNENLAKDLRNERRRNLFLKNKVSLLEREKTVTVPQEKFLKNCLDGSRSKIVLIMAKHEEDK